MDVTEGQDSRDASAAQIHACCLVNDALPNDTDRIVSTANASARFGSTAPVATACAFEYS